METSHVSRNNDTKHSMSSKDNEETYHSMKNISGNQSSEKIPNSKFKRIGTLDEFRKNLESADFARELLRGIDYKKVKSQKKLDNIKSYATHLEKVRAEEIKSISIKANYWVATMILYSIIQCSINIFACFLFALDGYVDFKFLSYSEQAVAIFFTLEMILNFYTHPNPKFIYFTSYDFWVDLLTVAPEYIIIVVGSNNMKRVGFLRILRVFKIMRIVKLRKTLKKVQIGMKSGEIELKIESISRFRKQAILLVVSLFATLFIAAGAMIFIQDSVEHSMNHSMKFIDSFYFVVITVGTIGYGDIYPISTWSRLGVAVMLVIFFTIFGDQISKIVAIMKESDMYDVKYSLKQHIVVFNDRSIVLLSQFLLNYLKYHENAKILVIDDVSMSKQMKKLMEFELFIGHVCFLSIRNAIDTKTLSKGCIHHASHIFFLTDPFSEYSIQQDKKALFLKNFLINNQIKAQITLQFSLYDEQYLLNFEKDYYIVIEEFVKKTSINRKVDDSISSEDYRINLISKSVF